MLKHLTALEADYRELPSPDPVKAEAHLWSMRLLRRYAEALWFAACAIRRAHRGHQDVQFEWLCGQLCTIWLWDFHAPELTISVPSWGGAPRGPLIMFMLTAIGEVVPEEKLPSPYALRDAVQRERNEREKARQLGLFLRERRPLQE
jgi:hypothetical protein